MTHNSKTASSHSSDLKSVRSNSAYLISGQILSRLMQVAYSVALIRHYGALEYGMFQSAIHWYVALVPLTLLGFGPTLALRIGARLPGSSALIGKTLIIRFVFAALLCACAVTFALLFPSGGGEKNVFLLIFAPLLVLRALLNWTREVYTAHEDSRFHFRQICISHFIQLVTGLCIMHFSHSLQAIGLSMITVIALELVLSAGFIRKKYIFQNNPEISVDFSGYVKQSLPIGFSQLAIRWMLLGPVAVGQWMMKPSESFGAVTFVVMNLFFVCLLFDSVSRAWLTVAGRQLDHGSFSVMQTGILKRMAGMSVAISFLSYMFGPHLMKMTFGTADYRILTMFGFGMSAVVPYAVSATFMQSLIVRSSTKQILMASAAGLTVSMVLLLFLTGRGIDGGVIVCTLSGVTVFSGAVLIFVKEQLSSRTVFAAGLLLVCTVAVASVYAGINL